MDEQVQAVLDSYEARRKAERDERRRIGAAPEAKWRDRMLLAVGPETGRLINILARSLPRPTILELGTAYGYSGIWLADAARTAGGRVISVELAAHKVEYARAMATQAGLADHVEYHLGDAVSITEQLEHRFDFVLLDLWKDVYEAALDAFYPKLNPGAIIVADNMIQPGGENAGRYRDAVRSRPGMTSVLLPVGTGIEVSRYEP